MTRLNLIPIVPDQVGMYPIRFLSELRRAFNVSANLALREFRRTVTSWRKQPIFRTVAIGVDETAIGTDSDIYLYLNFGTSKRWAVMSRDWRSKTRPGRLRSTTGSGRVVIAGRQAMARRGMRARKGIEARRWDLLVQEKVQAPFLKGVITAINRSLIKG